MKVSYAIPVCNERDEIERLVTFLVKHRDPEDEIVVLFDETNGTKSVENFLDTQDSIILHKKPFKGDFAEHKNALNKYCTGDWIFQLDADEYPDDYLMKSFRYIIDTNPDVQAFWVPRINTVQGLKSTHVNKWRWAVDAKGRVNFPDFQMRLYVNDPKVRWSGRVHEQLTGYSKFAHLPSNDEFCIHHPKTIERQVRQNKLYDSL